MQQGVAFHRRVQTINTKVSGLGEDAVPIPEAHARDLGSHLVQPPIPQKASLIQVVTEQKKETE